MLAALDLCKVREHFDLSVLRSLINLFGMCGDSECFEILNSDVYVCGISDCKDL